jgi:hypothetical protein
VKFHSLRYSITAAAFVASCMVPMRVVAQGNGGATDSGAEAAIKAAEAKPTPRTADGHPDLNGYWNLPALAPKSAHVDANGNLYIDVPRVNGGKGGVISETLLPPRRF